MFRKGSKKESIVTENDIKKKTFKVNTETQQER